MSRHATSSDFPAGENTKSVRRIPSLMGVENGEHKRNPLLLFQCGLTLSPSLFE